MNGYCILGRAESWSCSFLHPFGPKICDSSHQNLFLLEFGLAGPFLSSVNPHPSHFQEKEGTRVETRFKGFSEIHFIQIISQNDGQALVVRRVPKWGRAEKHCQHVPSKRPQGNPSVSMAPWGSHTERVRVGLFCIVWTLNVPSRE